MQLLRFNVVPESSARIGFSGPFVHAFFFRSLSLVDPRVARLVHDVRAKKAYSVTPLMEEGRGRPRVAYDVRPGSRYFFRIGALDERLAALNLKSLLRIGPRIRLGEAELAIADIEVRVRTYEELRRSAEPIRKFQACFVTPTHFRVFDSTFHRIFPEPFDLLDDLLTTWNAFAPKRFRFQWRRKTEEGVVLTAKPYRDWLKRSIGPLRHHIWTAKPVTEHRLPGFVGFAVYELRRQKGVRQELHGRMAMVTAALLEFARFANVGGGRTLGLGVMDIQYK